MDTYDKIATQIAREQELIIGPIAWKEASSVSGARVNLDEKTISIDHDDKQVINALVSQYERFFGKVSHEVCRDAVKTLISKLAYDDIPSSLR